MSAGARATNVPARDDSTVVGRATRSPQRFLFVFMVGVSHWSGAHDLVPAPETFDPPFDGRFRRDSWTMEMSLQCRMREALGAALYLGGDLGAFPHDAGWRNVGEEAITGEGVRSQMTAATGHVTLSGRLVWREKRPFAVHCAAGVGLYLLRITDTLEGTGATQTGNDAASPGGYAGVGFSQRLGRRLAVGLHFDARVHAFRFENIGPGFSGQKVGGPLYQMTVGLGFGL
jgi:hypothetical protein